MILDKLKKLSIDNRVAFARQKTLKLIVELIKKNNYKFILEIGTGCGYSSNYLVAKTNNVKIDTIEKNVKNFESASSFISPNINYIFGSVFEYTFNNQYDLIFIDGPKTKQDIIFQKLKNNLTKNGMIVIDNIFLKNVQPNNKNRKKMILKNEMFKNFLLELKNWSIEIIDIDDGVAICQRKTSENYC